MDGLNVPVDGGLISDTSLIKSGLFDSAALLNLATWIQKEVGPDFDLLKFDLSKDWETVTDIENFIQRHRKNPSS